MAAPSYEQIQSYGQTKQKLIQSAFDSFMELYDESMTADEIVDLAALIADNYDLLANELGAQWYDLCTRLANIDAELADLQEIDTEKVRQRARAAVEKAPPENSIGDVIRNWLQTEIENSTREVGYANLWRDYERGLCAGKWARVPVGETCAWCLMLASQGAWYTSKETALGANGNHYHDDCNCIAVYHTSAESIPNYKKLLDYKSMYYKARNTQSANGNGKEPYPEELQKRIAQAKENHKKKVEKAREEGKEEPKWTSYNETLIVMRYQNAGLK